MADKKSGPTAEDIMTGKEMKPLLNQSGEKTIYAVIGLTEDKTGVILLDRKMKPKKLLSELKAKAKKIKLGLDNASLRFGIAKVDDAIDSSLVTFTVNKGGTPGILPMKLKELLKEAQYQKVEIGVDEKLENEPDDETETEEQSVAPPPPPIDLTDLTNRLAQLKLQIPSVADGDSDLQTKLVALADTAQAALTAVDAEAATTAIEALRQAMAAATEAAKLKAGAPTSPEDIAKSAKIWLGTRKKVEDELDRLRTEIVAAYQDQGIAGELETRYKEKVAPLLNAWDTSLAVTLAQAAKAAQASDSAARSKLIGEAKAIMMRYAKVVASEKIIGDLDNNPFTPLAIQKTVAGTLAILSKTVH